MVIVHLTVYCCCCVMRWRFFLYPTAYLWNYYSIKKIIIDQSCVSSSKENGQRRLIKAVKIRTLPDPEQDSFAAAFYLRRACKNMLCPDLFIAPTTWPTTPRAPITWCRALALFLSSRPAGSDRASSSSSSRRSTSTGHKSSSTIKTNKADWSAENARLRTTTLRFINHGADK